MRFVFNMKKKTEEYCINLQLKRENETNKQTTTLQLL